LNIKRAFRPDYVASLAYQTTAKILKIKQKHDSPRVGQATEQFSTWSRWAKQIWKQS